MIAYLLWSNKHAAWWAPGDLGYTIHIELAGRYTEADAVERVVRSANSGIPAHVTCMVAAPDNWAPPQHAVAETVALTPVTAADAVTMQPLAEQAEVDHTMGRLSDATYAALTAGPTALHRVLKLAAEVTP